MDRADIVKIAVFVAFFLGFIILYGLSSPQL